MKLYIAFVLVLISTSLFSQSTSKNIKRIQFRVSVLGGPVDGERGTSAQIEVVPSIMFKGFSMGIGTGVDYYFIRSVPVFMEVKKAFLPNRNSVFVYVDAGFDYPWPSDKNLTGQLNFTCGHRLAGGIGYQIVAFKKTFLQLSVGYSYKQLKQNVQGWMTIYDPRVDWFDFTQHYNYKLNRLAFNIGLSF